MLSRQVGATRHFASASPLQHCLAVAAMCAECSAVDFGSQSYFLCKWSCVRQLCTAELVRLTAAGGGVPPLRKRVQRSRAALKITMRLSFWHLVRRALA